MRASSLADRSRREFDWLRANKCGVAPQEFARRIGAEARRFTGFEPGSVGTVMKNVFTADVTFLSREEGGRERPPFQRWEIRDALRVPLPIGKRSGSYLPDARFDDLPDEPPNVMYGLLIEWIDASEDGLRCHMQFVLRADETGEFAQQLHQGSRFQLFEGHKLVARGRITEGPFELPHMLAVGV